MAQVHLPKDFFCDRGEFRAIRADRLDAAIEIIQSVRSAKVDGANTAPEPAEGFNYGEERARREHYEAEASKLKYLERKGQLVESAEVQRSYSNAVKRTRDRLLQIPRQLSAEAVGLDAVAIEKLFDTAIRDALKELRAEANGVELINGH